jgi:hypothetical protein
MTAKIIAALGLALGLAACNTEGDLTRGLIGAGAGCIAGELIDDACGTGAAIGGIGGVVANDI